MIYPSAQSAINSGVPGAKTIKGTLGEAKKLTGLKTKDVDGRPVFFSLPINEVPQTDPLSPNGIWHVPVGHLPG